MLLFYLCDKAKLLCELRKTFILRCCCKLYIHIRPLIVFSLGGSIKIPFCPAKFAEFPEPEFGVSLLIFRRFQKQGGNLFKTLFFCDRSKETVLVSGLRLPGKCFPKVLLGLCSCILVFFIHNCCPLSCVIRMSS